MVLFKYENENSILKPCHLKISLWLKQKRGAHSRALAQRHNHSCVTLTCPTLHPERLCEVTVECVVWMASLRKIQPQKHVFWFSQKTGHSKYISLYFFIRVNTYLWNLREDCMNKIFLYWQTPDLDNCISILFSLFWQHQCTLWKESQMFILFGAIKNQT